MRKLVCLITVIISVLICLPEKAHAAESDSKFELAWDYLTPFSNKRQLDTVSLHILEKISATENRSVYRGLTITRASGSVILQDSNNQPQDSSARGIGPVYMVRNEKYHSGKLSAAIDMSGGLIVYDKAFPAGGRPYNFMWRIGPQFIYKFNENTSINIGYMLMHVSNGFKTHNPSYNAHGVSLGFVTNF